MTVLPKLTVQNKHQRMTFAEWAQNNEVSFNDIWFSDETLFQLDDVIKKQNVQFWASENPRNSHEEVHHASRIKVWVAILSHGQLRPISFEETVNSERYLSMLRNNFCLTYLLQVCRDRLGGSCRMEPGCT
jgi:hypothetical protein